MRMMPGSEEGSISSRRHQGDDSFSPEKAEKPLLFKVKLRLSSGGQKEAIVQRGEDPEKVARRLARLYGLRKKEEGLVLMQLRAVLGGA
jgi:hypothetical protein